MQAELRYRREPGCRDGIFWLFCAPGTVAPTELQHASSPPLRGLLAPTGDGARRWLRAGSDTQELGASAALPRSLGASLSASAPQEPTQQRLHRRVWGFREITDVGGFTKGLVEYVVNKG